jgi:hypothetical protein
VQQVTHARELFWNNVMREILTALSVMSAQGARPERPLPPSTPDGQGEPEPTLADPLDGRMAVVTTAGERIPIADVYPLFACGIPGSAREKALSLAVECTVFQIRTPGGEVYTLPLHEIRGFHSLSESLMRELAEAAQSTQAEGGSEPFGFAAFTSLARSSANGGPPGTSSGSSDLGPGI